MKIVVIGGTGLIGSKTVVILREGGHEVVGPAMSGPPAPASLTDAITLRRRTIVAGANPASRIR